MDDDLQTRILSMSDTSHRRMFGADCFLVSGRMFAFLMPDGLVLKLPQDRYDEALKLPGVQPFTMRGMPFGKWAHFPAGDAAPLLPWLDEAFAHVRSQPPKPGRRSR